MIDPAVARARHVVRDHPEIDGRNLIIRMFLTGMTVKAISEKTGVHPLVVRRLIEARRHA